MLDVPIKASPALKVLVAFVDLFDWLIYKNYQKGLGVAELKEEDMPMV